MVVTGGFHTAGITKLLEKKNVSYIVITPSVTTDTKLATQIYDRLAKEDAEIMFQAFALPVLSKYLAAHPEQREVIFNLLLPIFSSQDLKNPGTAQKISKVFKDSTGADISFIIKGDIKADGSFNFAWKDEATKQEVNGIYEKGQVIVSEKAKAAKISEANIAQAKKRVGIAAAIFGVVEIALPISSIVATWALSLFFWFLAPLSILFIIYVGFSSWKKAFQRAREKVEADDKAGIGAIKTSEEAKERVAKLMKDTKGVQNLLIEKTGGKVYVRPRINLKADNGMMYDEIELYKAIENGVEVIKITYSDADGNRVTKNIEDYQKGTFDDISDLVKLLGVKKSQTFKVFYTNVRLVEKLKEIVAPRVNVVQKMIMHEWHHVWFKKHVDPKKHKWLAAHEEGFVKLLDTFTILTFRKSNEKDLDTTTIPKEKIVEYDAIFNKIVAEYEDESRKKYGVGKYEKIFANQVKIARDAFMSAAPVIELVPTGGGKTTIDNLVAAARTFIGRVLYKDKDKETGLQGHLTLNTSANEKLVRRDENEMQRYLRRAGINITTGIISSGKDGKTIYQYRNKDGKLVEANNEKEFFSKVEMIYAAADQYIFQYLRETQKPPTERNFNSKHWSFLADEIHQLFGILGAMPFNISGAAVKDNKERKALVEYLVKKYKDLNKEDEKKYFKIEGKKVELTKAGKDHFMKFFKDARAILPTLGEDEWYDCVQMAAQARFSFKKKEDYAIVQIEGKKRAVIVNRDTGELFPASRWSNWLHQFVEGFEGLEISDFSELIASITLMEWLKLPNIVFKAGFTGTMREILAKRYGFNVRFFETGISANPNVMGHILYKTRGKSNEAVVNQTKKSFEELKTSILIDCENIKHAEALEKLIREANPGVEVILQDGEDMDQDAIEKLQEILAGKPIIVVGTNINATGMDAKIQSILKLMEAIKAGFGKKSDKYKEFEKEASALIEKFKKDTSKIEILGKIIKIANKLEIKLPEGLDIKNLKIENLLDEIAKGAGEETKEYKEFEQKKTTVFGKRIIDLVKEFKDNPKVFEVYPEIGKVLLDEISEVARENNIELPAVLKLVNMHAFFEKDKEVAKQFQDRSGRNGAYGEYYEFGSLEDNVFTESPKISEKVLTILNGMIKKPGMLSGPELMRNINDLREDLYQSKLNQMDNINKESEFTEKLRLTYLKVADSVWAMNIPKNEKEIIINNLRSAWGEFQTRTSELGHQQQIFNSAYGSAQQNASYIKLADFMRNAEKGFKNIFSSVLQNVPENKAYKTKLAKVFESKSKIAKVTRGAGIVRFFSFMIALFTSILPMILMNYFNFFMSASGSLFLGGIFAFSPLIIVLVIAMILITILIKPVIDRIFKAANVGQAMGLMYASITGRARDVAKDSFYTATSMLITISIAGGMVSLLIAAFLGASLFFPFLITAIGLIASLLVVVLTPKKLRDMKERLLITKKQRITTGITLGGLMSVLTITLSTINPIFGIIASIISVILLLVRYFVKKPARVENYRWVFGGILVGAILGSGIFFIVPIIMLLLQSFMFFASYAYMLTGIATIYSIFRQVKYSSRLSAQYFKKMAVKGVRSKWGALAQAVFSNFQKLVPLVFSMVIFGITLFALGGFAGLLAAYGIYALIGMGGLSILVSVLAWKKPETAPQILGGITQASMLMGTVSTGLNLETAGLSQVAMDEFKRVYERISTANATLNDPNATQAEKDAAQDEIDAANNELGSLRAEYGVDQAQVEKSVQMYEMQSAYLDQTSQFWQSLADSTNNNWFFTEIAASQQMRLAQTNSSLSLARIQGIYLGIPVAAPGGGGAGGPPPDPNDEWDNIGIYQTDYYTAQNNLWTAESQNPLLLPSPKAYADYMVGSSDFQLQQSEQGLLMTEFINSLFGGETIDADTLLEGQFANIDEARAVATPEVQSAINALDAARTALNTARASNDQAAIDAAQANYDAVYDNYLKAILGDDYTAYKTAIDKYNDAKAKLDALPENATPEQRAEAQKKVDDASDDYYTQSENLANAEYKVALANYYIAKKSGDATQITAAEKDLLLKRKSWTLARSNELTYVEIPATKQESYDSYQAAREYIAWQTNAKLFLANVSLTENQVLYGWLDIIGVDYAQEMIESSSLQVQMISAQDQVTADQQEFNNAQLAYNDAQSGLKNGTATQADVEAARQRLNDAKTKLNNDNIAAANIQISLLEIESAKAERTGDEDKIYDAKKNLLNAQKQLATYEANPAQWDVDAADAALTRALNEQAALPADATQAEKDEAQAKVDAAKEALYNAKIVLDNAQKIVGEYNVQLAQLKLDRVTALGDTEAIYQANIELLNAKKAQANYDVQIAQAELDLANLSKDQTAINKASINLLEKKAAVAKIDVGIAQAKLTHATGANQQASAQTSLNTANQTLSNIQNQISQTIALIALTGRAVPAGAAGAGGGAGGGEEGAGVFQTALLLAIQQLIYQTKQVTLTIDQIKSDLSTALAGLSQGTITIVNCAVDSLATVLGITDPLDKAAISIALLAVDYYIGGTITQAAKVVLTSMYALQVVAQQAGITMNGYTTDLAGLKAILDNGGKVILFVDGDHFVTATGVDSDGNITYMENGVQKTMTEQQWLARQGGTILSSLPPSVSATALSKADLLNIRGAGTPEENESDIRALMVPGSSVEGYVHWLAIQRLGSDSDENLNTIISWLANPLNEFGVPDSNLYTQQNLLNIVEIWTYYHSSQAAYNPAVEAYIDWLADNSGFNELDPLYNTHGKRVAIIIEYLANPKDELGNPIPYNLAALINQAEIYATAYGIVGNPSYPGNQHLLEYIQDSQGTPSRAIARMASPQDELGNSISFNMNNLLRGADVYYAIKNDATLQAFINRFDELQGTGHTFIEAGKISVQGTLILNRIGYPSDPAKTSAGIINDLTALMNYVNALEANSDAGLNAFNSLFNAGLTHAGSLTDAQRQLLWTQLYDNQLPSQPTLPGH
ncbi:MAG: hypothetical protein NT145_06900 [Elusimicrobia bacterium]|nr:hypothetical protein [Elusimicrobiota bacterium]